MLFGDFNFRWLISILEDDCQTLSFTLPKILFLASTIKDWFFTSETTFSIWSDGPYVAPKGGETAMYIYVS